MGFRNIFVKALNAFLLPESQYQEHYRIQELPNVKAVKRLQQNNRSLPAAEGKPLADEPHVILSGGISRARNMVLNHLITEQARAGYAVLVLQSISEPVPSFFDAVYSVSDGSYDPLTGLDPDHACSIIEDMAEALDIKPSTLAIPLYDCFEYLYNRDGKLGIDAFICSSTREIGRDAFYAGNDNVAASHALPESREIDYIRRKLRSSRSRCQVTPIASITSSIKSGCVNVFRLPQEPAWLNIALSEVARLSASGEPVFPIFCEMKFNEASKALLSRLTCGRCFAYQDLPNTGWLWNEATYAVNAACFLQHSGPSAEQISRFFHNVERQRRTSSTQRGVANCDTGGFMGLFGSHTVSKSTTVSYATQWEALIPAGSIASLKDDEAIFMNRNSICKAKIR